jgi:peptidoglycan-N-acetylglucosamine deacetylase
VRGAVCAVTCQRWQISITCVPPRYNANVMDGWIAGTAAAAGTVGWMAWAVRGRSSAVFGPSVWRGPGERNAIALTFDDGPSESTGGVLDILARYGVAATFFQCGANVERLTGVARAVAQAGHEIGNHSFAHPLYCRHSPRAICEDLERAQQTIQAATGRRPAWFRAPFGVRWFGVREAQRRLGLGGVMWTVIGYDWNLKAEQVAGRIVRQVSNGAIVCLHDGRELRAKPEIGVTIEAVRRVIPELLDRGYRFETVSQLLCPTN